ncbi:hypothetical protein RRF57_009483 [Xylaria bambusicola]|uniref:Uncharacterized protein n=1 Tax=Xylaria bambusicola TaxID=326684 RepID=A0AAN7V2N6_9PEZI
MREPLVAVGNEEVGIEAIEVDGDLPDSLCAIHQAQNPSSTACFGNRFIGEANAREARHRVEQTDSGAFPGICAVL